MRYESSFERTKSLVLLAILATIAVVLLPAAAVLAAAPLLPEPRVLVAVLVGVLLSGFVASLGANLWRRRPESVTLSFGELMLWRYLRRRHADERIASSAEFLGLAPAGEGVSEPDIEPDHQLEILHDLSAALETKDPYTVGHSRRVERHVYRTAMVLGLHSAEIEDLRLAASLHDVGKINVPDRILRKPEGLTAEERAVVQQHAPLGASMVVGTVSEDVVEAILHHHESWDGTGYPDRLSAEDIPLLARIICVADAYDAMTSARPYKVGSSRREAIDALQLNAGIQFDPDVVEAFVSTLPATVPITGAIAIFALPAQGARKLTAWLKNTGGGSLTTATGSAGMVAMLGAAALLGTPAALQPAAAPAPAEVDAVAPPSSIPRSSGVTVSDDVLDELFGSDTRSDRGEPAVERSPVALAAPGGSSTAASGGPPPGQSKPPPVIEQPSEPGDPEPDPQGPPEDPPPGPGPPEPSDDPAPSECTSPSENGKGQGQGKEKGTENGKGHQGHGEGKGHEKHCD